VNTVFLKNVHTAETAAAGTKRGHATPDQAPPGCLQRTACLLPPAAGHDRAVEPRAPGLRRTERAACLNFRQNARDSAMFTPTAAGRQGRPCRALPRVARLRLGRAPRAR